MRSLRARPVIDRGNLPCREHAHTLPGHAGDAAENAEVELDAAFDLKRALLFLPQVAAKLDLAGVIVSSGYKTRSHKRGFLDVSVQPKLFSGFFPECHLEAQVKTRQA